MRVSNLNNEEEYVNHLQAWMGFNTKQVGHAKLIKPMINPIHKPKLASFDWDF